MADPNRELRLANARRWGHIQEGHLRRWYDLEAFRTGACSLRSIERAELGDVSGKRLLHLQCNAGLDALSLARRGATVTGVDLSEENVAFARSLAEEVSVPARFLCHDVLELDEALDEAFEVVFASYGVFCWIDDVPRWMRVAASHLEPGGLLSIVEDHPACSPFDEAGRAAWSYFHEDEPQVAEPADESDRTTYEWQWTVSDLVNATLDAGLVIERLGEYPVMAWRRWETLEQDQEGWWRQPGTPSMPLTLSLRARKPETAA